MNRRVLSVAALSAFHSARPGRGLDPPSTFAVLKQCDMQDHVSGRDTVSRFGSECFDFDSDDRSSAARFACSIDLRDTVCVPLSRGSRTSVMASVQVQVLRLLVELLCRMLRIPVRYRNICLYVIDVHHFNSISIQFGFLEHVWR